MMKTNFIYITVGSKEEAKEIGKDLVSSKLAACVNVIDGVHSIYRWEGEIQSDDEVVLIAKTKETLIEELIEKVKSLHSYSVPCIVSLTILKGNKPFLDWILNETK